MTAADKFGIAFSIGFTVALVAVAMSFAGMSQTTLVQPAPAPAPTPAPAPAPTPAPAPAPTPAPAPAPTPAPAPAPTPAPAPAPTPAPAPAPAMSAKVSIPSGSSVPGCEATNECYIPAEVTIGIGGTVTWTNDDTAAHTVTSGNINAGGPDGVFDSSIFMAGKTFEHTFDEAGEYDYFCIVHPWMTGKVIVE
ncbi:Protease inhibitor Kazal-type (fragment) [Candidatus Nitrosotenuis uzonensis]|uniref:Protease inhibitor Kazal-type n=2 Tax=Candidatus Nitrosotenuis uzonensis TaxID=1407055 RepID=V6ATH1_9ARCH